MSRREHPVVSGPVLGIVFFAALVGIGGGFLFGYALQGDGTQPPSEFQPATGDRIALPEQAERGVTPAPPDRAAIPDGGEETQPEDPALRAIRARLAAEQDRLAERQRLAWDSPLTPGVADAPTLVTQRAPEPEGAPPPGGGDIAAAAPPDPLVPDPIPEDTEYPLARGSVIPAVLETPIDSDLPGLVRARVSEDVLDSTTGTRVLIPRGAALVGTYGSDTRAGQRRLFVAWTDLRMPDGTRHDLDKFATLGADGASGVRGRRATGLLTALGAAVLFDLAGNATQILTGTTPQKDSDLGALIAQATGSATGRVAEDYLGQLLERGPRFRVRAGTLMNVLVEKDITLPELRP